MECLPTAIALRSEVRVRMYKWERDTHIYIHIMDLFLRIKYVCILRASMYVYLRTCTYLVNIMCVFVYSGLCDKIGAVERFDGHTRSVVGYRRTRAILLYDARVCYCCLLLLLLLLLLLVLVFSMIKQ